jgi:molybdopterin molybdotransferase
MDGYALAFRPGESRTTFTLRPRAPGRLRPGEACGIATGSVLPLGATAVARLESSRVTGDQLRVTASVPLGRDVHRAGSAIARGSPISGPGRPIDGYEWATLLAAGVDEVPVRELRMTVLATGDELARPRRHRPRAVDAIGPWIESVAAPWATVQRPEAIPDNDRALRAAIETACRTSDLVVTIGGTSIGPRDRTKPAVAAAGRIVVGGTRLNVLKRAGVGWVRGRPVLMLPGQAVAAMVAFHEFGLRLIGRWRDTEIRTWESRRLAVGFTVDHRMDSTVLFERVGERVRPLRWGVARYSTVLRGDSFGYFARGRSYPRDRAVRLQRFIRSRAPKPRRTSGRRPSRARAVRRRRRP